MAHPLRETGLERRNTRLVASGEFGGRGLETEVVSDQRTGGAELIARADGADTEATLAAQDLAVCCLRSAKRLTTACRRLREVLDAVIIGGDLDSRSTR